MGQEGNGRVARFGSSRRRRSSRTCVQPNSALSIAYFGQAEAIQMVWNALRKPSTAFSRFGALFSQTEEAA